MFSTQDEVKVEGIFYELYIQHERRCKTSKALEQSVCNLQDSLKCVKYEALICYYFVPHTSEVFVHKMYCFFELHGDIK